MTGPGLLAESSEVTTWEWVCPGSSPALVVGFGLIVQQVFLRWNMGQELRQALITIAVSVIIADQVIAHFPRHVPAGVRSSSAATRSAWPGLAGRTGSSTAAAGVDYSLQRLVVLALGVMVGARSGSGSTGRAPGW